MPHFNDKQIKITRAFPVGLAIINLVFVLGFLAFSNLAGFKSCMPNCKNILLWMTVVWLSNMMFSVAAAPIELRYQLFPLTITFTFAGLLLAFVIDKTRSVQTKIDTAPKHFETITEETAPLS
ncbi:hypothetical protein ACQ86N_01380 [Puia sp. P3]|uniref:hypothetical protein n=1 Tax=Puia sp. P3 TaxID=3423952 RepID=UPI003D66AB1B